MLHLSLNETRVLRFRYGLLIGMGLLFLPVAQPAYSQLDAYKKLSSGAQGAGALQSGQVGNLNTTGITPLGGAQECFFYMLPGVAAITY